MAFASLSFALGRTRRETVSDSDGRREGHVNASVQRDVKEYTMAEWTIRGDFLDSDGRVDAGSGAQRRASAGVLASVLLGFATMLAAPQAAHAVDKVIWSETMTVAATSSAPTVFGYNGFEKFGSLSGSDSINARTIDELGQERYLVSVTNDNTSPGTVVLSVSGVGSDMGVSFADPLTNATFRGRLTLDVGSSSFAGTNAAISGTGGRSLTWSSSGLTWVDAQMIAVSLTLDVPGITSIAFTSSPATGTTYDTGETVSATVTFDEAVDVTGTPQLTINVGGTDKVLDYASGTGTTALVFSGRVAFGDTDADGLSIAADKLDLNGGTIKATADANPAAVLTHTAVAASASHKVNGATAPPAPTVSSIAFNSAGTDGAFMTGDAVTATVTFDDSVTVDTMGGTPQLTIKMGGADKVLDYSSGSPGTALVFSGYTVAANDEDTDGLSIEANKLDANGGTIQETADTSVAAVLTHAAVSDSANHKVDGVKPTLTTTGDDAPKTSVDGSKIILVFSEAIGSVDTSKVTVKVGTTDQTISSGSTSGTEVEITLSTALSATATNITVALAADAVTDVPGNGIAAVSATSVTRTLPPGKPTLTLAAKDQSIDATVVFATHGTSNITKYQYQIKSGSDAFGSWTDSTDNVSNTGGTFTIGSLTNGTEYTVQVRGVNSDGEGAASDAKSATPDAPPAITTVAITSTPATASTYVIGEEIEFTITFDKNLTIAGTDTSTSPAHLTFLTDYAEDTPGQDHPDTDCQIGTDTKTLVCTGEVAAGWYDDDGIAVGQNALDLGISAHLEGPLGQRANYDNSALAADSNHKIDGIRPTLSRADADPNDLTKVILTFSEAIGTVTQADITVKKGTTDQTITAASIDSTDATKVVVTLMTALLSTDTNVTVDLAADAVKDVPGNGIAEVLGTSVSVEDNVAPVLASATVNAPANWLRLTYNEALDTTSVADKSAFAVTVEGNSRGIVATSILALDSKVFVLTLSSVVRPGEAVTVSYTKPATDPIKDASANGNEAASFSNQAVTNDVPAKAPEAPGNLVATATHADKVALTWDTPWHNGSPITRFEYRVAEGGTVPSATAWTAVTDSGPTTTGVAVEGLKWTTDYAFEVRAVNDEGNGGEAAATATTLAPAWEFTLKRGGSNVTQLTEGGATAIALVRITNDVRFSSDQPITLKWGTEELTGLIQRQTHELIIPSGTANGSAIIHAPDRAGDLYHLPETRTLTANLGAQVGDGIELTYVDDEAKPVISFYLSPTSVHNDGTSQLRVVEGRALYPLVTLSRGYDAEFHPGVQVEVTGAASKFEAAAFATVDGKNIRNLIFFAASDTQPAASSLHTADNSTVGDTSDHVFTVLPSDHYTIGTRSSATLRILDNDVAPTAPRNLTARARDGAVLLTWDRPTSYDTVGVTKYELRHVAGSTPGGTFGTIFPIDPDATSHTVTGLTNGTEYTFEVRAVNDNHDGAAASVTKTPNVGVAVSFGAATASVDEGESATVTVTLGEAPTASVTVPITATPGTGLDTGEYSGVPSNVTFASGTTSRSFTVTTVDDADDEPDRVLTFSLGTLPEGYVPGTPEEMELTIADNDVPIVSATFHAATESVQEGTSRQVTVSLSQAPEREVVVPIVARRGANLAADEVSGVPENVTFAADETAQTFTVTIADDTVEEGNETLTLTLGTYPDRVQAGTNTQLVLTVTDDDGPPDAPADLTIQTGDGFAALSWPAVSNDSPILRYEVRWQEEGGSFNAWLSVNLETSYRAEDLTNGTAHTFEVRAVNEHGEGEAASAMGTPTERITGIPKAVQVLQVKATDSARAELSWTRPSNGTDRVTATGDGFAQIQGYRIEVCRTSCGNAANWYAVVANTGEFKHTYTHQVLAPGVIRENRYRVRAININGKTGPWSNTATLEPTRLERFWLVAPSSSTVNVHLEVWHPDGNPLYVRYTGGGEVRYAEKRLTKQGYETIGLPVEASTHYKVDVDFVDTFDSDRFQTANVWSLQEGADPYTSPYAADLVEAQVWQGGTWRGASDTALNIRMGETGKYRLRLKPCTRIYTVNPQRIESPAGRLETSPTDLDPALFANLRCEQEGIGYRTDENGNKLRMKDVYDMTNFPDRANDFIPIYGGSENDWYEVTVTASGLFDYPLDRRYDALLSAPFAVVYNHRVSYGSDDTRSGLVSEGTGLVRILVDKPADAVLPVPSGVTIGSDRVMTWDAVPGATGYLVVWRYGPHYSDRANTNRSLQSATTKTLPLGASGRGPITARVRAYSNSKVGAWSPELTWDTRAPTLSVLDTAVNEDDGSVGFLVRLSPAATGTVTVDYATRDGTAVAPADYTATSGTLTFAPGQTEKQTALVPIVDDDEEDSGETFTLVLSNPTGSDRNNGSAVLGDAEAVATILNSEQEPAPLTGFTLVDAGNNTDLMALAEGSTVRLGDLLASSYGIRANLGTGAAPGSVRLELSGAKTVANTDDASPYSLYGDGAGRLNGGSLPPGSYTLTATAYANSGAQGDERGSLSVSFTVAPGVLKTTTPGPFEVAEGATAVATLAATETGAEGATTWSIPDGTAGGADGDAFAITSAGALSFTAAKDFEAPDDADGDGTYEVTVEMTSGEQTATAALEVTLSDVDEPTLAVTTAGPFTVAEGETAVAELAASGVGTDATASWSIPAGAAGGADGAAFALTAEGVLSLVAAKDFEAPDDADGDGTYEVTVAVAAPATVMAGARSATAALSVTLSDVNEAPVAQASASPAKVREGARVTLDGSASADPDAGDTLTYTWTQAEDGTPRVTLSDAAAAQPVFTSPSDLTAETALAFTLKVTDAAGLHSEAAVTVTVTLIPEVSVAAAADYVTEGAEAVFRVTRAGSARAALTVPVTVEETGSMLGADVPASVTLAAGAWETHFEVPTTADTQAEDDSVVTAEIAAGAGWTVDASTASVTVLDDDAAPPPTTSAVDVTVWSADMTVVEYGTGAIGAGSASQFSNQQGVAGLRAKWLWHDPATRVLKIAFDDGLDDADLMTLHVGDLSVTFPNPGGDSSFNIPDVDVSWTDGETLAARVSRPSENTVSTDATLASLTVSGATLSPAFDAGTLVYRAAVDSETATVAASATDDGAAVTYGSAQDADAELADYQVAVPATGDALVDVTVTAEDGTVRRYRVLIARAAGESTNTAPTGLPAISGTAEVGATLTASADDIDDADGIDDATFTYRWRANGAAIDGATGTTYEVRPGDVGKTLNVRVTFTDDGGTAETLDSAATEAVVDNRPTLSISDASGTEGDDAIAFTVALDKAATGTVTVDYATANATADSDDYTATSGTLTFAAGDTEKTVSVAIGDDDVNEDDETFTVTLSNASGATLGTASATGTIKNRAVTPSLSISGGSGTEGDHDAIAFTVTLDQAAAATVTVDYATADGSATAGDDYTATSGTLTFAAGDTEKTVSVAIGDDTVNEDDETFTLTLSNASGATLGTASATGTIKNRAITPTVSIAGGSGTEGDDDAIAFTVTLDQAAAAAVTVDYATADGSATAGDDYTATSGTLTFAAGDTEKTVSVAIGDDEVNEDDETFTVTLSNATGATLGTSSATGTIKNRAVTPTLSISGGSATEGDDGTIAFTVTLDRAVADTVTVDYATAHGTADGDDYTATSGTLSFAAGDTEKTVSVAIGDDEVNEDDETFTVTLSNASGATLGTASATGTIENRNVTPTVSISGGSGKEGDDDAIAFAVTLDRTAAGTVTVDYATADGTADGDDYTASSGTLSFAAGETSKSISVAIGDDEVNEDDETFTVTLSNPSGAALGTSSATGTIKNREVAPLTASFSDVPAAHDGSTPFTFKLTFSEAPDVSYVTLRDHAFTVSGDSKVKTAQRAAPPSNLQWNITVEPSGDDDVTVALSTTSDCAASGAICTSGGLALTVVPAALTIAGPDAPEDDSEGSEGVDDTAEEPVQAPLTAWFGGMPDAHEGPGELFAFQLTFSEAADVSYVTLRDHAFGISGGTVDSAVRRERGSNLGWTITVKPTGWGDVRIAMPGSRPCTSTHAICTTDGRRLSSLLGATVPGPVALSVADASATEGSDAVLEFAVTLSRAATATVTVNYATSNGTATAGADYTATSGVLTFQPGDTVRTVNVAVLDDAHDDAGETMTLVLSNAAGARLRDGEATGTIVNADPIPQAWLARFGRAASDHVMQAIDGRLSGGARHTPETHFTLGGRQAGRLFGVWDGLRAGFGPTGEDTHNPALADASPWARMDRLKAGPAGTSLAGGGLAGGNLAGGSFAGASPAGGSPADGNPQTSNLYGNGLAGRNPAGSGPAGDRAARSAFMNGLGLPTGDLRDVLMGSSFFYSRPLDEDGQPSGSGWLGQWSAWGETAATRFSGADGPLSLDGEVATAILGADSRWGRWLAGVTLSHSLGEGAYTHTEASGGAVASTLTSLNPYAHYRLNDRASVWGVLGYGVGGLTLTPQSAGSDAARRAIETDLATTMAAFGGRGVVSRRSGGFELAVVSDALMTNTVSESVENLAGATGATSRLRLLLEGSGSMQLATGGVLQPTLEAGLRYDGGDAETGAGIEIGGGLGYAAGQFALEIKARTLLAHEDSAYEEWGFSGSIRYRPRSDGRGLSMNLGSAWGAAQSGVQSLWSGQHASGPARGTAMNAAQRYQAELGYGVEGRRGRALWYPYVGSESAGDGAHSLRVGLKLTSGANVDLGLELGRGAGVANPNGGSYGAGDMHRASGGDSGSQRSGDADEAAVRLQWAIRW